MTISYQTSLQHNQHSQHLQLKPRFLPVTCKVTNCQLPKISTKCYCSRLSYDTLNVLIFNFRKGGIPSSLIYNKIPTQPLKLGHWALFIMAIFIANLDIVDLELSYNGY
jgi:hypothetical protein